MAYTVTNLPVGNDSVIYEHIIPRSVRQKWMRQTSVERLGPVVNLSVDKPASSRPVSELHVENSKGPAKENVSNDFGDSIVSHDVQGLDKDGKFSETLISPEEEKAVFNAFGVKLRHTARDSKGKRRVSSIHEASISEISKEKLAEIIVEQSLVHMEENNMLTNGYSLRNGVQLRENTRKPRPRSMPNLNQEIDYILPANGHEQENAKPKAYISPHTKVPWKRNLKVHLNRPMTGRNDAGHADQKGKKEESSSYFKVQQENEGKCLEPNNRNTEYNKQLECDPRKDDKTNLQNETPEGKEVWQSVVQRCKSFEKFNNNTKISKTVKTEKKDKLENCVNEVEFSAKGDDHHIKIGHIPHQTSIDASSTNSALAHLSKQSTPPKTQFSKDKSSNSAVGQPKNKERKGKDVNDSLKWETNDSVIYQKTNGPHKQVKLSANEGKVAEKESNHKLLIDIFQNEPEMKKTTTVEKEQTTNAFEESKHIDSSITSKNDPTKNAESDHTIAPSILQNYKKKINKMIILTGEQREQQLKTRQVQNKSSNKSDDTRQIATNRINITEKETLEKKTDIPVTNLDDMMPLPQNGTVIPVTNLDEPFDQSSNKSVSNKDHSESDTENLSHKKPRDLQIKKPGKYDADRRELVAPKVYFEHPVTGLVSSLSPKGKKREKKKMRVSFQQMEELEKVHMYPSETAAIEMYDDAQKTNDGSDVTNIDDALANMPNSEFQSYMPSSFVNLADTLERERSVLTERKIQSDETAKITSDNQLPDEISGYKDNDTLFTESSISGTNALLF